MKRWHLTFGLSALAVGAAFLAPRLFAHRPAPAALDLQDLPVPPPIEPIAIETPPAPALPTGHLIVDAGLDYTAAPTGRPTERMVAITVSAPADQGEHVRRPVDLAVVMDTSGSMSARGKIDQARRAAKLLAERMGPGDTYSLTVFNDDATVVVPATSMTDPGAILLAIDRIYEGGGTNLYAGMSRGADEVRRGFRTGTAARVVVLSDGKANVGVVDDDALVRFAAGLPREGVALSTIGLGLDYNEDLLARIADVGSGTYDFVDDASQLESVFSDELQRVASVVARDTKVELRLPPGVVPLEVIGWDAELVDGGWNVYLGEVFAGETKKIIARVRVSSPDEQEIVAATASAVYYDVTDGVAAVQQDTAELTFTSDPSVVDRSVDRTRAIETARARGSQYLDLSTRAYAEGDRKRSVELAKQGQALLRDNAAALGDDALSTEADGLRDLEQAYEMHTPSSTEGRTMIKANKERFRDLVR